MRRVTRGGRRPRVFVGSSSEGRRVAETLQVQLGAEIEATVWCQGVFGPASYSLETLREKAPYFDFAVVVMTPDDLVHGRDAVLPSPRDNVLVEFGLFVGVLGRRRTIVLAPGSHELARPSDLEGVTVVHYHDRRDGDLHAAVGPAASRIRDHVLGDRGSIASTSRAAERESSESVAPRRRRRSLGHAEACTMRRKYGLVDISVTGALLETDGPIDLGETLDLELALDDGRTVQVLAEVVRVQEPDWGRHGGVGIRFLDYRGDAQSILDSYVESESTAA